MKSLPKRKYAPEFRAEAVKLVESGVSQAEVARRLGISLTTLSGWCLLGREGKLNASERKPASDKDQEIAQLTANTDISRQGVTKHLQVLAEAGVVRDLKQGRERLWQLEPGQIEEARRTLEIIGREWEAALARLKAFVEST
jgi:transposase-like protein